MLINKIDQSGASASGDIVAGDKNVYQVSLPPSRIEQLMERLAHEIETKAEIRETIEQLQFFHNKVNVDDVVGLEAKLTKAGRDSELYLALAKKEQFAKLLEKYSLYSSAQRIFAYILAKAEHQFNSVIYPQIACQDIPSVNILVTERIVDPLVSECGIGPIDITHSIVMGMIYWLADQCFVRWH